MKLVFLFLLLLSQINAILVRSGPHKHRIIEAEKEIGFEWKNCDEIRLPTYYYIFTYNPVIVEFLDAEANYNKTNNLSYRTIEDWHLNDDNHTYFLPLSRINGSCYLYTYNPGTFNILIETDFKTEFLPGFLEKVMFMYFLYVFVSLITYS